MINRFIITACALCFAASAGMAAEPISVDFTLTTEWRGEVITLPPRFAPDMKTKGVEDIRFAPGMFKPEQSDFFSYVFVITSTTGQTFDKAFLHSELLTYYKGLAKAVSKGTIDPKDFSLELGKLPPKDGDIKASYTGKLDWVEPFATKKPQILHFDIQISDHNNKEYLFVCVSPQKTDHAIWKEFFKIRKTFAVKPPVKEAK